MYKSLLYFIEKTPSIYFIRFDLNGKLLYANRLFKKRFAHSYTNFIGENLSNCLHKDSLQTFQEITQQCLEYTSDIVKADLRNKKHDDIDSHTKWNFLAIINEESKAVEIGGVGYSTTAYAIEKKGHILTQQKLLAMLNSTTESIYFIDKNKKLISYNNGAAYKSKLYYNLDLHEGFDVRKLLVPGTEERFERCFNEAFNGIENNFEDNLSLPTFEKEIWYKMTTKPVYDDEGKIIGVMLSFLNISEIKSIEEKLKKIAWEQSHRVRKPLSNILGLVSLLKDEKHSDKVQELLNMLDESAKELDEIVKYIVHKTL